MVMGPETFSTEARPLNMRAIIPTDSRASFQVSLNAAGTAASGPCRISAVCGGAPACAARIPMPQ